MCPAAGQSAEQGSRALLSTEYTARFTVPADTFRHVNGLGRCQSRAHLAASIGPRRRKRPALRIWNYAERSPRKSGGEQCFNRNRSA